MSEQVRPLVGRLRELAENYSIDSDVRAHLRAAADRIVELEDMQKHWTETRMPKPNGGWPIVVMPGEERNSR